MSVKVDAPVVEEAAGAVTPRTTRNNFDLIRLVAAAQVAFTHAASHLAIESPLIDALKLLPGVPVFFLVSGYLIYQSYVKSKERGVAQYYVNRVLRLYPALFLVIGFSVLTVWATGYFEESFSLRGFMLWMGTGLTAFQFYNPDFLRGYGVGVVNGSLWTISVELQFYIVTPILFLVLTRKRRWFAPLLACLIVANIALGFVRGSENVLIKLYGVSFLPWLYMFALGAWLSTREDLLDRILAVPLLYYLLGYATLYLASAHFGLGEGNFLNPPTYFFLVGIVFKAAYSFPGTADRLLNRNDISYGVYIYHMPIINVLVETGYRGQIGAYAIAMAATFLVAGLSWILVEKPALRLKSVALRRI